VSRKNNWNNLHSDFIPEYWNSARNIFTKNIWIYMIITNNSLQIHDKLSQNIHNGQNAIIFYRIYKSGNGVFQSWKFNPLIFPAYLRISTRGFSAYFVVHIYAHEEFYIWWTLRVHSQVNTFNGKASDRNSCRKVKASAELTVITYV